METQFQSYNQKEVVGYQMDDPMPSDLLQNGKIG